MTDRLDEAEIDESFRRYCRSGRAEDLARVFDALAAPLRSEARALLRDEAGADDLVQSTFLAAIELRDRFEPERGTARAWLRGLLRHRAMHTVRDRRRDVSRHQPMGEIEWHDGDRVALRELADQTRAAIERLPEPYASSVRRVVLLGESAEQVATDNDRPAATVRSQVHRGVRRIRRALPTVLAALARAARQRPIQLAVGAGLVALGAWLADRIQASPPKLQRSATSAAARFGPEAGQSEAERQPVAPLARHRLDLPLGERHSDPVLQEAPEVTLRAAVDGRPLAETWVLLEDGSRAGSPTRERLARTDEAGRLDATALDGARRLRLPWARVEAPTAGRSSVDVPPGFEVRGTVRDAADRPVSGALVLWCAAAGEPRTVLELARTDAEGRYRADHLSPSRPHLLVAVRPPLRFSADQTPLAAIATEVGGSTGSRVRADLRIRSVPLPTPARSVTPRSPAPQHSVWLDCESANPSLVGGWTLGLFAGGDDTPLWLGTLRSNGLEIVDPPQGASHGVLFAEALDAVRSSPRPLTFLAHSKRASLHRDAGRWRLRFAASDLPTAHFALEVPGGATTAVALDPGGTPAWIRREPFGSEPVDVGPLPAGAWTLAVQRRDGLWQHRGPLLLERPGQCVPVRLDVGEGRAELLLEAPNHLAGPGRVLLCAGGAPLVRQPEPGTDAPLALAPGTYELFWSAPGVAGTRLQLALGEGTRRVALPESAGEPIAIELEFEPGARPVDGRASVDVQVCDAETGTLIWRERQSAALEPDHTLRFTCWLPQGRFQLWARERRGAVAQTHVLSPAQEPLRATLIQPCDRH